MTFALSSGPSSPSEVSGRSLRQKELGRKAWLLSSANNICCFWVSAGHGPGHDHGGIFRGLPPVAGGAVAPACCGLHDAAQHREDSVRLYALAFRIYRHDPWLEPEQRCQETGRRLGLSQILQFFRNDSPQFLLGRHWCPYCIVSVCGPAEKCGGSHSQNGPATADQVQTLTDAKLKSQLVALVLAPLQQTEAQIDKRYSQVSASSCFGGACVSNRGQYKIAPRQSEFHRKGCKGAEGTCSAQIKKSAGGFRRLD